MWPISTEQWRPRLLLLVLAASVTACGGLLPRGGQVTDVAAAGPDAVAQARFAGVVAALAAGDDAQAGPQLQALVVQYPAYAGPMINLALVQARRGELAPASVLLEQAVAVCTRCAPAWNALGIVQRQQGRFADAEQSYLKALAVDPGYADAAFNLGVLYEIYLQRPGLALDQYARFRELLADDPAGGDVDKWIADLKRRARPVERSAQLEGGRS